MLYDPEKQELSRKLLSTPGTVLKESGNIIFSFAHKDQQIKIYIHTIINESLYIFVNFNGIYKDDTLRLIPFILLEYMNQNPQLKCFIFYSNNNHIIESYSKILQYMPQISYWSTNKLSTTTKYQYLFSYQPNIDTSIIPELFEYID